MTDDARRDELAANLADVRSRMAAAARDAGRDPADLTLVAVTKTWPAADVRRLVELGIHDVGENRDQEASDKARELRDLPIRWHFVGQLQTNKVRSVVEYAHVVESVDRPRLAATLDRACGARGRTLRCLVQVALDDVPGRGGVVPADLAELADDVASRANLTLDGLMAVAPLGMDPDTAFARLAELHRLVQVAHPRATTLSAGMTADLEAAVRHGATHVRIGTAVLGHRPGIG